jgi:cytochrome c oxidase subunit 2
MKTRALLAGLIVLLALAGTAWAGSEGGGGMGWLPPNYNDAYGDEVDGLYNAVLILVTITFFLTEGLLLLFCFLYKAKKDKRATYSHGSMKAEAAWTIVPAAILAWLAIVQAGSWQEIRTGFPDESDPDNVVVQVMARQFDWEFRWASADGVFSLEGDPEMADDIMTTNRLFVPYGKKVLCKMSSIDVIHSFFIPYARVKQDAMPGIMTKVWFEVSRYPVWNLQTQELEHWTEEDFNGQLVGIPWNRYMGTGTEEFVYSRSEPDKYNVTIPSWNKKEGVTEVTVLQDGKLTKVPADDVNYVLHFIEIACAELCGMGHYGMDADLFILPPVLYEKWLNDMNPDNSGEGFAKWKDWYDKWDVVRPQYNLPQNAETHKSLIKETGEEVHK